MEQRSKPLTRRSTRRTVPRSAGRVMQVLLATLVAGLAACGGGLLGGGAPLPDTPDSGTVTGEVERVEAYANEIDLWTEDRRIVTVRYTADTPVYYRGERYTPAELEAGDVITVRFMADASGERVAERIDVDRGRQDRTGSGDDDPYDPRDDDPYDPDEDDVATLSGEVEKVDTRDRKIEIDSGRERVTFGYRTDTVVYYQGERYRVENLEPGDVIRTRVERDYRGDWITGSITVERSRQERGIDDPYDPDDAYDPDDDRYGDEPEEGVRYAGTVEEIDTRRGEFVLRTERYGLKTIVMPFNASRADRQAFDDLRRGDRVRIEAEPMDRNRAELLRFGWR